jgi:hypothetical protein
MDDNKWLYLAMLEKFKGAYPYLMVLVIILWFVGK